MLIMLDWWFKNQPIKVLNDCSNHSLYIVFWFSCVNLIGGFLDILFIILLFQYLTISYFSSKSRQSSKLKRESWSIQLLKLLANHGTCIRWLLRSLLRTWCGLKQVIWSVYSICLHRRSLLNFFAEPLYTCTTYSDLSHNTSAINSSFIHENAPTKSKNILFLFSRKIVISKVEI